MFDNPCTDYYEHDRLVMGEIPGGKLWEVMEPFRVEYAFADGRAGTITVPGGKDDGPVGFETDLSSSPPGFRNLVARIGLHIGPSVAHDWLYVHGREIGFSRADADWLFLRGMDTRGYPWWRRMIAFAGVRIGGWGPWSDHENERIAEGEA